MLRLSRWLGPGLLLALTAAAGAAPAPAAPQRFVFAQVHMGMRVRLVLYAPDQAAAEVAGLAAFERIKALDHTLSDYLASSELSRLCAAAGGPPQRVSDDLWRVLVKAGEVCAGSRGAFDPTVAPVVRLWRAARRTGQLPSEEARRQALALVGWDKLRLNEADRTVQLTQPGMRLDLGGIAKGFVGDEAVAAMRAAGCPSCLFEAGGDIVLGDAPPDRPGWTIGFEDGRRLELSRCGVAASGDTVQYVVIGGVRYSHVVDPKTGLGLSSRVATNVIAVDGATSDALSTAASVMGVTAGQQLIDHWPGAWGWMRILPDDPLPQPHARHLTDRGLLG